uniref:MAT1-2-1 n=1 Tax=Hypocrella siamensis TaxID=696354 RepID=A0A0P0CJB3_9HYPO|nr:MAT1-2-1 [Hypocrella siamensis]
MIVQPVGSEPFWIIRPEERSRTATVCSPGSTKTTRIPRPPNAYILYRKERHKEVKEANPGITNNEISQILGRAWNKEGGDIREKYKDMAERVKQALLKKHPDYRYKPRKPSTIMSEKKEPVQVKAKRMAKERWGTNTRRERGKGSAEGQGDGVSGHEVWGEGSGTLFASSDKDEEQDSLL